MHDCDTVETALVQKKQGCLRTQSPTSSLSHCTSAGISPSAPPIGMDTVVKAVADSYIIIFLYITDSTNERMKNW